MVDEFLGERCRVGVLGCEGPGNADVCIVHNDWPEWRDLTAPDFSGMRGKVVVDGRRILRRQAVKGVRLLVLGG